MANNQSVKFLERRTIGNGQTGEVFDLGAYRSLLVHIRVLATGSTGKVEMQHSALNENSSFGPIEDRNGGPVEQACNVTGEYFFYISAFGRYVRWSSDGSVGTPTMQIEGIAKEN